MDLGSDSRVDGGHIFSFNTAETGSHGLLCTQFYLFQDNPSDRIQHPVFVREPIILACLASACPENPHLSASYRVFVRCIG